MPSNPELEPKEWIVICKPTPHMSRSEMTETIRAMNQHASRMQHAGEREERGTFLGANMAIEWLQHDGNWRMIAKVNMKQMDKALAERFQSLTEAACFVAVYAWRYQYGRKARISDMGNVVWCSDDMIHQGESYVIVELLSMRYTEYRADLTLIDRHGRIMAYWKGMSGSRLTETDDAAKMDQSLATSETDRREGEE